MALACAPLLGGWQHRRTPGSTSTARARCWPICSRPGSSSAAAARPAGAGAGAESAKLRVRLHRPQGHGASPRRRWSTRSMAYLSELPLLALWIAAPGGPDKGPGTLPPLPGGGIDPAVVMAVPEPGGADWACPGPPPQSGCLPSKRLQSNGYWFRLAADDRARLVLVRAPRARQRRGRAVVRRVAGAHPRALDRPVPDRRRQPLGGRATALNRTAKPTPSPFLHTNR